MREHPIPHDLQPFVALVWSLESDTTSAPFSERILPDGVAEAVFHFAQPCAQRFRGDVMRAQPRSFVVLMAQRLLDLQPVDPHDVGFVAVRFQPGAFASFVDVPHCHAARDASTRGRQQTSAASRRCRKRRCTALSVNASASR